MLSRCSRDAIMLSLTFYWDYQCDQISGIFFYQIRLDALRQHPLLYIIATFRTGGGSPTRSKQLRQFIMQIWSHWWLRSSEHFWDHKLFIAIVFCKNILYFEGAALSCRVANLKLSSTSKIQTGLRLLLYPYSVIMISFKTKNSNLKCQLHNRIRTNLLSLQIISSKTKQL